MGNLIQNLFNNKFILATLGLVFGSFFSMGQKAEQERPNILFILADDMGWQDTSVPFGPAVTPFNGRYETPALERLAREGMKFTNAYSCTVCSPSRVSLMTGLNEAGHGVTNWTYLSGDKPSSDIGHPTLFPSNWNWNGLQPQKGLNHAIHTVTLPELLNEAGYLTMHFGKGHLGAADTPGADPKNFGFDVRMGGRDAGGCGSYYGTKDFGAKAHPKGPWRAWDMDKYFGRDIHLTEALTLEAKREIRAAVVTGQPFFCYFAHYAPHTPIDPDERFAPKYRAAGLDDTEAAYASLIEGVDKSTGDLLNLLDELGIAKNTIVVFTSDNGGVSHSYRSMSPPHTHNAPLSSGKGSHHEGGIRVPLLVRWPGLSIAGRTSKTPVMIYDWFPSLLEAAGVNYSKNIDGQSVKPILQNSLTKLPERPLVWHFPNFWGPLQRPEPVKGPGMGPCSAIRLGDWKLIYYHTNQNFELFNLKNDLGEKKNLADENPGKVKELANELSKYLQSRNAPMPRLKKSGAMVPYPADIIIN
jgi:arylsulfatase A-like enzyme